MRSLLILTSACAGLLASPIGLVSIAQAGPTYFLVAERPVLSPGDDYTPHGDSFVIGLDDPQLIDHARAIIDDPVSATETIVFASIRRGAGVDAETGLPVNRSLTQPGAPLWSWHVHEVSGFGEFGIELIDGWPSYVERDVEGWFRNTNGGASETEALPPPVEGFIGFWGYTVVEELDGYPASAVLIPLPAVVPLAGLGIASAYLLRRRIL
jgi:hypothetical protein